MAVMRSKGSSCASSNSKTKRDASDDPSSLDGSKRLRSRVVPPARPKAKPRKEPDITDRRDYVRPYATDAITFYNKEAGTKYELVEPGYITTKLLSRCFLYHIDFTAKKSDVAGAPVEMFFAELTSKQKVRCVKFCTSMGPKNLISGDKNNGCCYCMSYLIQHPRGGGFMAGRGGFRDENYNS
ncbi:hypothetical protein MKW94_010986 [Papaver nudicaule]|uniref:DUF3615 domain-containing protein n=1 Tax=Papaver nudicaule TaxID=74823 RepID=A0AA41VY83_PAPNU|nr:hypothetical protein [Papaver nudicaule]